MSHDELNNASQLIEKGEIAQARMIIKRVLRQDMQNIDAWWILTQIASDDDNKRKAAERVLRLQPEHLQAQQLLDSLEDEAIANLGDLLSQPKSSDLFDDDIFNLEAPVKRKSEPVSPAKSNVRAFATVAVLFLLLIALLGVFGSLTEDFDFSDAFDSNTLESFDTMTHTLDLANNDEAEIEINLIGLFTITAEGTGDFDPILYVYDRDSNQIGYNDDSINGADLGTFDAQIEYIYIDGYARIEVSEFGDDSGRAVLTIEAVIAPDINNSLEVGHSETFDIDVSEWFELNVSERRNLTIIVQSQDSDFDPVLEIFDEDFRLIEYNDDHYTDYDYLDSYDSAIEDIRLSGTVYIRVSDYSGEEDGDVTISVK